MSECYNQFMQKKLFETELGGVKLIAEFNDLAENAQGSVVLRYGDTVLLATACMSKRAKDSGDFFPLTVDYEERFYAVGKILGSEYKRRESSNDQCVLNSRAIDRSIRPLFDVRMRHEVQVIVTALSLGDSYIDSLAVIASSLALGVSPIPWNGPLGSIRIGRKNDRWELMPRRGGHDAMLTVCGKGGSVNMIEMESVKHESKISDSLIMEAMEMATQECRVLEEWQMSIIKEIGKEKKELDFPEAGGDIKELFEEYIRGRFEDVMFKNGPGRRHEYDLLEEWMAIVSARSGLNKNLAQAYFDSQVNELLHTKAINNNMRPDGRGMDDVRPLFAEAGGFAAAHHGTGIFYRGGTHILSVVTLGGPESTLEVENIEEQVKRRYWHHYNFPPYSSGDLGRMGVINRRAVGHGKLAEKALLSVLPSAEEFPYTMRVVSEALSSNGSTSMGSVCGSTLALMDAGVPIKAPVAGIASGLMMSVDGYKILTDIQGPEDHHGDMDFKVAGTREGITAVQMDVKVDGIPLNIIRESFAKAELARLKILDVMTGAIAEPRRELKSHVPKVLHVKIRPDQIRTVIGGGGKTVQEIRHATGAGVEVEDDGTVYVIGANGKAEAAMKRIQEIIFEWKPGDIIEGPVVRIADFGAWVDIGHGKDGMVHVSELAPWHVEKPSDLLTVGQVVPVVIMKVDERGRIDLSIKKRDEHFFDAKHSQ